MNLEDYGSWITLFSKDQTIIHPQNLPLFLEDFKPYQLNISYKGYNFVEARFRNDFHSLASCSFSFNSNGSSLSILDIPVALPPKKNILPIIYYAYLDEAALIYHNTEPQLIAHVSSLLKATWNTISPSDIPLKDPNGII